MTELWHTLNATAQDVVILTGLLLPVLALGFILLRGFAVWPLVGALLRRYLWINLLFVGLIALSIGTGSGLVSQERAIRAGTANAADKFDLVIGAPGSDLTLMFASVFLRPTALPLLDGPTVAQIAEDERTQFAAPLAFGDSYRAHPIVGTTPDLITHLSAGALTGRMFATPFEALAGHDVSLQIGQTFQPVHGRSLPGFTQNVTHGDTFEVVGRMPRTGSPWDRAVIVPVEGVWQVHGIAWGHAPDHPSIGPPFAPDYFPGTPAVVVRGKGLGATYGLHRTFDQNADTVAVFPGAVLGSLYNVLGDVRVAMSVLATLTQVLVAASVLIGLYILMQMFRSQLELLRILGAPRRFLYATVWSYCTTLLVTGTALGLVLGIVLSGIISHVIATRTSIDIPPALGWLELHLAAGFLSLAVCLCLIASVSVSNIRSR